MKSRGRGATRHKGRRRVLLLVWLLAGMAIVGRAASVQILDGTHWQEEALTQHRASLEVPAPRGSILD